MLHAHVHISKSGRLQLDIVACRCFVRVRIGRVKTRGIGARRSHASIGAQSQSESALRLGPDIYTLLRRRSTHTSIHNPPFYTI